MTTSASSSTSRRARWMPKAPAPRMKMRLLMWDSSERDVLLREMHSHGAKRCRQVEGEEERSNATQEHQRHDDNFAGYGQQRCHAGGQADGAECRNALER